SLIQPRQVVHQQRQVGAAGIARARLVNTARRDEMLEQLEVVIRYVHLVCPLGSRWLPHRLADSIPDPSSDITWLLAISAPLRSSLPDLPALQPPALAVSCIAPRSPLSSVVMISLTGRAQHA